MLQNINIKRQINKGERIRDFFSPSIPTLNLMIEYLFKLLLLKCHILEVYDS